MKKYIWIINPKTGLSKIIDATKYSLSDYIKTYKVYSQAGYEIGGV
jgi:hypothetical protein